MKSDSVLITGGAGFIGSNLATKLAQRGDEATLVDSLHPQVHNAGWPDSLRADISTWPFDVTSPTQWGPFSRWSGRTSSCIWLPRPEPVSRSPKRVGYGRVNILGTTSSNCAWNCTNDQG